MPITKPSMVSYADELNFAEFLEKLLKDKHNGFIRVTSGPDEGYILFKDGKQVAASYDRHAKSEAVENIKSAVEKSNTLIELFDLRSSHIDYIIDVNKPYMMESDYDVYKVIDELKGQENNETETSEKSEKIPESDLKTTTKISAETGAETISVETKARIEPDSDSVQEPAKEVEPEIETDNKVEDDTEKSEVPEVSQAPEPSTSNTSEVTEPSEVPEASKSPQLETQPETPKTTTSKPDTGIKEAPIEEASLSADQTATSKSELVKDLEKPLEEKETVIEEEAEPEPIDRSKLLEKYGIKEIDEDDVDDILDSYKGGSIDDDDVEKIEFSLMNKIKKSIFGIPKIKGAEVMVFLDNSVELTGNINVMIEYEAKGLFSRLMGESKDIDNLRRQIINIVQIEIKKSFRKYPEIIDNFDVNVEIS